MKRDNTANDSLGYPADIKQGASEEPSRSMIIIPYYLREMPLINT